MELFYLLAIVFVAYLVQATTGFGGALLSLPLVILLFGLNNARVITTTLSLITGLIISLISRRHINKKKLLRILAVMAVGTTLGMVIDRFLDANFLILIYGIVTILLALFRLWPKKTAVKSPPRTVLFLILFLAGVMQGLFVAGGAFLMIYAMYEFPDKVEFRATSSAVWGILNWFMLLTYWYQGVLTTYNLSLTAYSLPIVLLMIFTAEKLQPKINQAVFSVVTNLLLLATGVILLLGH